MSRSGAGGGCSLCVRELGARLSSHPLVRESVEGSDTRVTRGSRDDGIDGVIFDCDAALGGEYIVQAKRYKNVVPAIDVRALAGIMHDKRTNHALFVTTAWLSPDGGRFAEDNRVRLIEGPELRHLLLEHLELDVLIPTQRGRPETRGDSAMDPDWVPLTSRLGRS
jgi:restriction system protein